MNDPTTTLALCSWLKKRVGEWEADAKAALELETGERKAAKVAGAVIAYTNKVRGRKTVRVLNETMLLSFVKTYAPDEVATVESINPAYRMKLMNQVSKDKDGQLRGPDEVVWDDVVKVVEGEPYLSTKLTEEADITIAGLLAKGQLGVNGLKAIEGAEQ